MNNNKFDLSVPLPPETSNILLFGYLQDQICDQLRELDINCSKSGKRQIRIFSYRGIIHWQNMKHATRLLEFFISVSSHWRSSKTLDVNFTHCDVMMIVTKMPLLGNHQAVKIEGALELERLKIQSSKYPVTITFRLKQDDQNMDYELTIYDSNWHLPALKTLFCANGILTIESDIACDVFISLVLHDDEKEIAEQMEKESRRKAYRAGFRPTIDFPVP